LIYIIIGPSGSGKTLVGEYLKEKGMKELISHTTRAPRPGEVEEISYHFVDEKTFHHTEKVEENYYAGNYYGVSLKEIETKTKDSDVFVVTEINGARAFRQKYGNRVRIIYVESSPRKLRERMKSRGDSRESIRRRIDTYRKNQEAKQRFFADVVLNNNCSKKTLFKRVDYAIKSMR
jgi:guanylate kinase